MGGTELMFEELIKRLDKTSLEKISIFNYLNQADFDKITIFWNQLSYDQEAISFLSDKSFIEKIDHFVFVSHWQSEKFRQIFNIPGYKTTVIKNAVSEIEKRTVGPKSIVRLCYTSTPWRGLDVLLSAWEKLNPSDAELSIFSSCKIYGSDFAKNDVQFENLYQKSNELNNVIYRGSIKNEDLKKELNQFDILAYPNTFEETSCISVIEALSCGLKVVTSNLGALPETTEGWARIYPYMPNFDFHVERFSKILQEEIEKIKNNSEEKLLKKQIEVYHDRWNWDSRINEWNLLINELQSTFSQS